MQEASSFKFHDHYFTIKKWDFVYTICRLLINWPLSRGYFGSWDAVVERLATVERLK